MPLLENFQIWGCYAQTEIGTGSDVSGLKTTATYDVKTDEFVMHTPSLDATKWWPGELGRLANHALVFCRILIPGDDGDIDDYGIGCVLV